MTPTKRPKKLGLFLLGMTLAGCSAVLTAQAGYALHGWVMGVAFVVCTFGACFAPNEMVSAFRSGRFGSALFAGFVTVLFVGGEFAGEMMVMSSSRGQNAQHEMVQSARYDDVRKSVAALERRLASLQETYDKQLPYGTSASYESQIKEAEELAAREGSKDRNGCKAKCDAAKAKATDLRAKHAIALDRETKTEPELKRVMDELAAAKSEAKTTDKGFSISQSQTGLFTRIATANLNPDGSAKEWTEIYFTLFMAFLFTFGSAGLTFMSQQDWAPKPVKDRKSTRLNSSHVKRSRMPSSA